MSGTVLYIVFPLHLHGFPSLVPHRLTVVDQSISAMMENHRRSMDAPTHPIRRSAAHCAEGEYEFLVHRFARSIGGRCPRAR